MNTLLNKINEAAKAYYEDEPILSDEEYDTLIQQAEREGLLKQDSQVADGATLSGTIKHDVPMLSLAKANSVNELKRFLTKINELTKTNNTFVVQPKLDGLALSLKYKNGKLVSIATRGTGEYGEDASYLIDHTELAISNLQKTVPDTIQEVRGELVCSREDLHYNNEQRQEPFKNERIAVSGLLKKAKLGLGYTARLDFVAYNAYDRELKEIAIPNAFYHAQTEFHCQPFTIADDIGYILDVADIQRTSYLYPTDGVVIKMVKPVDLGNTSHHPLNAIAYKYPSEEYTSKLLDVKWQVGKTGRINPVACIEPTTIDNVTISNITLNNLDWIEALGLTIGSTIAVKRANDVIPCISKVLTHTNECITYPNTCPCCQAKTVREKGFLYCPNESCYAKKKGLLLEAVSKQYLDIEGMNESILNALDISSITQLLLLGKADFEGLTYENGVTVGMKRAEPILNRIQELVNGAIPEEVLVSLLFQEAGMRNIGLSMSKTLLKVFHKLTNLFTLTYQDLIQVNGVGDVFANSFMLYQKKAERLYYADYDRVLVSYKPFIQTVKTKGTFCITGKPPEPFKNRDEFVKEMESMGWVFHSSVRKDTDYLVCENPLANTSKLQKARGLGVHLVTELPNQ